MDNSESLLLARQRDISSSGVSWGAVIAGAFVAAALSLIMLALGTGLGLSSMSPWSNVGGAASKLGAVAIVWLILMQVLASAMGGYLAGRLRTRWQSIHNDEVHFRDTANGLVAWAVGLVLTVVFLTTAATAMVGGTARESSGTAVLQSELSLGPGAPAAPNANRADLNPNDGGNLALEESARKATAHALLWIFIALLTGAFCSSYAATIGGRQRDRVQVV